ncbi:MAG: tryptophan synthase subunit alpha [Planctomycetota bacterium]|jgi:tryptophan synthase alpha chain|nr:tryptophan synthase subunit alpha [Planctomycetota bacterium]
MPECELLAHLVAGYPDWEGSRQAALALAAGGAGALEVQFPFSDPSADGPRIERACHAALAAGFKVEDGFRLVGELTRSLPVPLFIMTYASLIAARGAADFAGRAAAAGAWGLIVPDLPPDYDEGLFAAGRKAGLTVAPVLAPGISDARLELLRSLEPEYAYTALRLGITGGRTTLDAASLAHLDRAAGLGAKIIAGFGVRTREQFLALSGRAWAAAVGSHFLARLEEAGGDPTALRRAAAELRGTLSPAASIPAGR